MKANFKSGSVRGVRSNSHPYRDRRGRRRQLGEHDCGPRLRMTTTWKSCSRRCRGRRGKVRVASRRDIGGARSLACPFGARGALGQCSAELEGSERHYRAMNPQGRRVLASNVHAAARPTRPGLSQQQSPSRRKMVRATQKGVRTCRMRWFVKPSWKEKLFTRLTAVCTARCARTL